MTQWIWEIYLVAMTHPVPVPTLGSVRPTAAKMLGVEEGTLRLTHRGPSEDGFAEFTDGFATYDVLGADGQHLGFVLGAPNP